MKQRKTKIKRVTKETQIELLLNLDGRGEYTIETPVGFFNHMLDLFAMHGLFDLKITTKGDTHVDKHHTIEDVGIVLGQAFYKALGEEALVVMAFLFYQWRRY